MNGLEKLALEKLRCELISANDRCHESNAERFQHERIFVKGDIGRALDIVKALLENYETQKH